MLVSGLMRLKRRDIVNIGGLYLVFVKYSIKMSVGIFVLLSGSELKFVLGSINSVLCVCLFCVHHEDRRKAILNARNKFR